MVNLTIDSKKVEVEEGSSILQAAEKLGIEIPTMCYHKALPAYGACRLCLVEVNQNGRTSIQTSCTYPALEGLDVKTDTERVIRNRKIMVELLLARCPDAEDVKKLAEELGVGKPRIELRNEDCLLCGLCVRMCSTRMGRGAISFAHRGGKRIVQPAFDVQSDVCQTCGACFNVCPTKKIKFDEITDNKPIPILSEFDAGLVERSAIYRPYPQAVPNYANIDAAHCVHLQTGECQLCKEFCEADAINFDQLEHELDLNVGAIILASGAKKFDPSHKYEFGYGKYPNVLTSMEFERILSASGPFAGHVQRPSDGKVPTRIAWIQCVGSRDELEHKKYCSSVCCMYAIKEAVIAKEHVNQIEPTIFYMDIRAYGKDFDAYYNRAKDEFGVRFVRSRVGKVVEIPETGNLMVYYSTEESGRQNAEEFDIVVLSIGFESRDNTDDIADKLGIRINKHGFFKTTTFSPVETSRPGIFVCGPASSPKDIPETVMQASGAVAGAGSILAEVRGTAIVPKEYPPERDVSREHPRIGVFVCHCGINIGSVVDVPAVVEYAKTLPNVMYAEDNLFTCSQDTQEKIKEMIAEHNLNRVVVASCTPRTHEPLFQETLRESGLNPRLFEMANIRDQCSWVHRDDHPAATRKAKYLVRMAVAKSPLLESLPTVTLDVNQSALVIGGGLAGMVSALSIAEQGFPVAIIEKEPELGGNLRHIYHTPDGEDTQEFMKSLIEDVVAHPNITVYKNATIESTEGYIGNYKTQLAFNGEQLSPESDGQESSADNPKTPTEIEHGVIVVATGAEESTPTEYLFGEDEKVITQRELERRLFEEEVKYFRRLKNVVMIQCVGSRDEKHPWCSRVCCTEAIKNAIKLKETNPKTNVFILYRDIRTYGFHEELYQNARDAGIIFIRYDESAKPVVEHIDDALTLKIEDPILKRPIQFEPDLLVLAPAIVPREGAETISKMLKTPLNENGFFLEAHVKLRPVDFATEGIFLAGMAHAPKTIDESISQAMAAAARACTLISSDKYTAESIIANVNQEVCVGCGICEAVCPYTAPQVIFKDGRNVSHVNIALCKGCGNCACSCPSGAMEQLGFKSQQTQAILDAALTVQ